MFQNFHTAQPLIDQGGISLGHGQEWLIVRIPNQGYCPWGLIEPTVVDDDSYKAENATIFPKTKKGTLCRFVQQTSRCPRRARECKGMHVRLRALFPYLAAHVYFHDIPPDLHEKILTNMIGDEFGGTFFVQKNYSSGVAHVYYKTWDMAQRLIDRGLKIRDKLSSIVKTFNAYVPPGPYHTWMFHMDHLDPSKQSVWNSGGPEMHGASEWLHTDSRNLPGLAEINPAESDATQSGMNQNLTSPLNMSQPIFQPPPINQHQNMSLPPSTIEPGLSYPNNNHPVTTASMSQRPVMSQSFDLKMPPGLAQPPHIGSQPLGSPPHISPSPTSHGQPPASNVSKPLLLPRPAVQLPPWVNATSGGLGPPHQPLPCFPNPGMGPALPIGNHAMGGVGVGIRPPVPNTILTPDEQGDQLNVMKLELQNSKIMLAIKEAELKGSRDESSQDAKCDHTEMEKHHEEKIIELKKQHMMAIVELKSEFLEEIARLKEAHKAELTEREDRVKRECAREIESKGTVLSNHLSRGYEKKIRELEKRKAEMQQSLIKRYSSEISGCRKQIDDNDKKRELLRKEHQRNLSAVKSNLKNARSEMRTEFRDELVDLKKRLKLARKENSNFCSELMKRQTEISSLRFENKKLKRNLEKNDSQSHKSTSSRSPSKARPRARRPAKRASDASTKITADESKPKRSRFGDDAPKVETISTLAPRVPSSPYHAPPSSPHQPSIVSIAPLIDYPSSPKTEPATQAKVEVNSTPPMASAGAQVIESITGHTHLDGQLYFKVKYVDRPQSDMDWCLQSQLKGASVIIAEYWNHPV
eukprot:723590_1